MANYIEPSNESYLLYRILAFRHGTTPRKRIDEGDGLQGLQCRALHLNYEMPPFIPQGSVKKHIEENPDVTPWISTSTNLQFLEKDIESSLLNYPYKKSRHLVIIDARFLNTETVDLTDERVRIKEFGYDTKSHNYAKYWDEVLIYEHVSRDAIICSRQYFLTANDGIDFEETENFLYRLF